MTPLRTFCSAQTSKRAQLTEAGESADGRRRPREGKTRPPVFCGFAVKEYQTVAPSWSAETHTHTNTRLCTHTDSVEVSRSERVLESAVLNVTVFHTRLGTPRCFRGTHSIHIPLMFCSCSSPRFVRSRTARTHVHRSARAQVALHALMAFPSCLARRSSTFNV